MKKIISLFLCAMLLLSLFACSSSAKQDSDDTSAVQSWEPEENVTDALQIRVEGASGENIVFQLNDSTATKALYEQLPLSIEVDNYSNNEKIFYPPKELDTSDAPLAEGPSGTLAYYAPWGNVVLFYGKCEGASGLYELGEAVSGVKQIETLSGEIQVSKVEQTLGSDKAK